MPLDTRLIAKVNQRAGALIHEANGLLQLYTSWHYLWKTAKTNRDKEEALVRCQKHEKELRIFLATKLKG